MFFLLLVISLSLRQGQEAPWWTAASPQRGCCSPGLSVGLSWWPRWEGFSPLFPTGSVFYDASQYGQPPSPPRAMAVSVSWRTMDDGGQYKREQLCMGGKTTTTTTEQLFVTKNNSKYGHSYEASGRKAPIVPASLYRQAERKVGGTMLVCCTKRETRSPLPGGVMKRKVDMCILCTR